MLLFHHAFFFFFFGVGPVGRREGGVGVGELAVIIVGYVQDNLERILRSSQNKLNKRYFFKKRATH